MEIARELYMTASELKGYDCSKELEDMGGAGTQPLFARTMVNGFHKNTGINDHSMPNQLDRSSNLMKSPKLLEALAKRSRNGTQPLEREQ